MNIIIPIGGIGKRFSDEHYLESKPIIKYMGKSMILHILDNIKVHDDDDIYIVCHRDLKKYNFKQRILDYYQHKNSKIVNQITFVELFYQTEGAVETLVIALKNLENHDKPVVSLDCDTFYRRDIVNIYREIFGGNPENNSIICFNDTNQEAIYSYIQFDNPDSRIVIDIKEKQKISDWANTGCYCFRSGKVLLDYCNKILSHREFMTKNEFYTSSVIDQMIKSGEKFIGCPIEKSDFVCLGTPHLLKINTQSETHTPKRFCFDLDYTLVIAKYDETTNVIDYSNTEPIWKNIKFLKFLKSKGHTIIIQTARRMKSHKGSIGKLMADIGKITFDTLAKYDIPYDEIYFGKPWADYYIDDRAVDSYYDLEKQLGYYNLQIPERAHHGICKTNNNTIIKSHSSSGGLRGEIYWFNNIPNEIKDLFPKLLSHSENNSYELEYVNGVTMSHFYLTESLTPKMLLNIFKEINRIHNSGKNLQHPKGLKSIYCRKLKQRYNENTDLYKNFPDSERVYHRLMKYFNETENNEVIKIIHGDPVFTNIILTRLMKLKFIDMRGLQYVGESDEPVECMFGDIYYDFGKIYQSLLGYDEILMDTDLNCDYTKSLRIEFEKIIIEANLNFYRIQFVSAYLLFTLIPLHKENLDKCHQYYNLINGIISKEN